MIIVAGSEGEIGFSLIPLLLENGYEVVGLDKSYQRNRNSRLYHHRVIDLSNQKEVDLVWKEFNCGEHSTLINLIGEIESKSIFEIFKDLESNKAATSFQGILQSNLNNIVLTSLSFAKFMFSQNREASIVNFGSISSRGVIGQLYYATSKGAVEIFSRALSLEIGRLGVRVNCIVPGYVKTDGLMRRISAQRLKEIESKSNIERLVTVRDIYHAIDFLIKAENVSGCSIEVNSLHGL
jgi:NAD(P)-dependent dehydrogenase (short-subunit alcohol dehydrogenase family)